MHLLVLSAFRLRLQKAASQRRFPGRKRRRTGKHQIESARTAPIKPHNRRKPPQIDPAPPTSPTHRYATGFQRTYTKRSEPRDSATVNTATKASVDYPSRRRDGPFSANRRFANRRFPVPVALPPAATSRSAVFRQPPHSGSAAGRSGAATVDKGRTEAGKNGQGGTEASRPGRTEACRAQCSSSSTPPGPSAPRHVACTPPSGTSSTSRPGFPSSAPAAFPHSPHGRRTTSAAQSRIRSAR